ncbi:hypothetical protein D7V95_09895 [bacterium J10(2018)]|jgi:hypothetical protein|nr:hypothetical protein D7V95_09895 [bacterium J10(2018)]
MLTQLLFSGHVTILAFFIGTEADTVATTAANEKERCFFMGKCDKQKPTCGKYIKDVVEMQIFSVKL